MGSSNSKRTKPSHRPTYTASYRDVRNFGTRLRTMIEDSSYDGGVKASSVADMIDDIHKCMAGRIHCIRLPVPVDGIAPAKYLAFADDSGDYVTDLMPRKSLTTGSMSHSPSIVSRRQFVIQCDNATKVDVVEHEDTIVERIDEAIREISDSSGAPSEIDARSVASRTVVSDTTEDYAEMEDADEYSGGSENPQVESSKGKMPAISYTTDFAYRRSQQAVIRGSPASRFTTSV